MGSGSDSRDATETLPGASRVWLKPREKGEEGVGTNLPWGALASTERKNTQVRARLRKLG